MATSKTENKAPAVVEAVDNEIIGADQVEFTVRVGAGEGVEVKLFAPADIMDADPMVLVHQENRRFTSSLVALLGEAQFDRLRAAGMTTRQIKDVMEAYGEATGAGEG